MKVGERIQAFRGWLDYTGHTSADSNWSSQLIYQHQLQFRANFITGKLDQGKDVSYENYKVIPCMELVKVARDECPCIPADGCSFRRTKNPMIRHIAIDSVSSLRGEIRYDYVPWDRFEDKLNHRIQALAKEPYFTHKTIGDNFYHYLHNDIHKKYIAETIIPYDPIEYALMPDCDGNVNTCLRAFDVLFPMDPDMESLLFEAVYNSLVQVRPKDVDVYNNSIKDLGLPNK